MVDKPRTLEDVAEENGTPRVRGYVSEEQKYGNAQIETKAPGVTLHESKYRV